MLRSRDARAALALSLSPPVDEPCPGAAVAAPALRTATNPRPAHGAATVRRLLMRPTSLLALLRALATCYFAFNPHLVPASDACRTAIFATSGQARAANKHARNKKTSSREELRPCVFCVWRVVGQNADCHHTRTRLQINMSRTWTFFRCC